MTVRLHWWKEKADPVGWEREEKRREEKRRFQYE
jgi:hypothetical protein